MRWLWLGLLLGCSAPGPSPATIAATELPDRRLDEAARERVRAISSRALLQLRAGDDSAAHEAARQALDLDPRAALARAVRAHLLLHRARTESPPTLALMQEAEGQLLLARRLAAQDPDVAVLHAEFLEADGHLAAACAVLDDLLAEHHAHREALRLAARLHYELGEERLALELYRQLLDQEPGDAEARYRLAQCRLTLAQSLPAGGDASRERQEALAKAAEEFRIYRTQVPTDLSGWLGEAHARFQRLLISTPESDPGRGEPGRAEALAILELYARASAVAPESADPLFGSGVVLEHLDDLVGAEQAYSAALARDPRHVPSLLDLVALLARQGRIEPARDYARRALELALSPFERQRLNEWLTRP